jgi:hypothetical protein
MTGNISEVRHYKKKTMEHLVMFLEFWIKVIAFCVGIWIIAQFPWTETPYKINGRRICLNSMREHVQLKLN